MTLDMRVEVERLDRQRAALALLLDEAIRSSEGWAEEADRQAIEIERQARVDRWLFPVVGMTFAFAVGVLTGVMLMVARL